MDEVAHMLKDAEHFNPWTLREPLDFVMSIIFR